jgi:hypothetical protein
MKTESMVGKNWNYLDWFRVPGSETTHPVITAAKKIATDKSIGNHPFIDLARKKKEPLIYWIKQELIVTGPFSLLLFKLCTQIKNVHLRAMMSEIVHGEHGSVEGNVAHRSHPWLLHNLKESMSIASNDVLPAEETIEYLQTLEQESNDLIRGLGALGIGSEFLLIEEYTSIKAAFAAQHQNTKYEDFLNSNIDEDQWHSNLVEIIASNLITSDELANQFLLGATTGVEARFTFYDHAFERMSQ